MTKHTRLLFLVLLLAIVSTPVCATKHDEAAADEAKGDTVVARVHGEPITLAELEEKASGGLKNLEQQRYDLLKQVLDAMTIERMVTKEADARGMTAEELMKAEIEDKVAEPTNEEVTAFYEENKERAGGRSLREVGNSIIQILKRDRTNERREEFLSGLREKAGVQLMLEPPRSEISFPTSAPTKGPADAPVTIVEYADFQCPYCRRGHPGMMRLLNDYKDKVRYVYRDFPLDFHPRAVPAAKASLCAREQEKYWEYHYNLLEMQGDLSDADLEKRATDLGLDIEAFKACVGSDRYEAAIQDSFEEGQALGVTGTPSFFINGRMVVGAKPYADLKKIVDEELALVAGKAEAGK